MYDVGDPDGIAAARYFQTEILGNAAAHDGGSVDAQLRHREIVLADRALAILLHFLCTVVQGHVAVLRFPVDVVLHTAEDELYVP